MKPDVCIVIPQCGPRDQVARAIGQVVTQDHAEISCLVVGADGPIPQAGDARVRGVGGDASRPVRVLRELCRTRPEPYVLWFDPRDELAPSAVSALLGAAGSSRDGAGVGNYVFWSRMGVVPGDPMAGRGDLLQRDDWLGACVAPTHTVLVPRRTMAGALETAEEAEAWDWRLWLAVTARGTAWKVCRTAIGASALRPGLPAADVLRGLCERALLAASAARAAGVSATARAGLVVPWAEAWASLQAAMEYLAERGAAGLHSETKFPEMFARWWQRLGYLGRAPRHVLEAHGGLDHAYARWPEAIAREMVARIGGGGRAVIVGLGRNGRHVARELQSRGREVFGIDEGLDGLPAWAADDGIRLRRLPGLGAVQPGDWCLVSPWQDGSLASRLPAGAHALRWSQMPRSMGATAVARLVERAESGSGALEAAA